MARTPDAKIQQLQEWYQMGVFGAPGSPGASQTFLEEQDSVRSDDLAERVIARMSAEDRTVTLAAGQQVSSVVSPRT